MNNLWNDDEARAAVASYAENGVGEDLALRTYSARLLGRDPSLVLHGGGNTSVKTTARELTGEAVEVLCVKGSGWDLASIEPAGHPAVRLQPLLRLRGLERLSDEDMVDAQRRNLMDRAAPNPSVETLLHAFLPDKFIDHTHATAILALADQPDAEAVLAEALGDRVAVAPYVMPGFALAKLAAEVCEANPGVEGLVLLKHGIFSFGATARESYERMIRLVQAAEDRIAREAPLKKTARAAAPVPPPAVLPVLRGVLAEGAAGRGPSRWVLDLRRDPFGLDVANSPALADWAGRGVATPDHVIRTKRHPLVLPAPDGDLDGWRSASLEALAAYIADYDAYFARNAARAGGGKTELDPLPRVVAIPGLGLIGLGKSAAEARVAGDIADAWAQTLISAERVGRFEPVGEADTFDMEYWSLEQAKLGKASERPLARHVVVVTGGAGAIGAATASAFAVHGADVVIIDKSDDDMGQIVKSVGGSASGMVCDITDRWSVGRTFDCIAERYGGVDIVVSNAGSATIGAMAELDDAALRASFELNFFAHQAVAQAAACILRRQAMGGVLLFNVSKQAVNPGPDFGAYGTAKAALFALLRQYAVELGAEGIRVNGVNADRIRSGLLTDALIETRSAARGVSAEAYMSGNLLGQEVTADDVAQAFVFAAMMRKTTGHVITVDGGNAAAMLR